MCRALMGLARDITEIVLRRVLRKDRVTAPPPSIGVRG